MSPPLRERNSGSDSGTAPWQAIREWIPDDDGQADFEWFDQRPDSRKPVEIPLGDDRILVLDSD